jgi:CBS domain-containing protein
MQRVHKTISELRYTEGVPAMDQRDSVARALDVMCSGPHDCVLVVNGGHVAGIFTGRDFMNRVAAAHADPAATTLADVMTAHPEALRPRDSVAYAINRMAMRGFRNVPIVDDDGHPLGVLTIWDVMRHLDDIFDELDAAPQLVDPTSDISAVTWIDTGGGG